MPKIIALFVDGTGNNAAKKAGAETNVHKLYKLALNGGSQVTHYMKGVGTGGPIDQALGGASGWGMSKKISEAYLFLAENYNPGDQIYLFGFSRGAFAVRSLAGFVGLVGILLKQWAFRKHIGNAYELYELGIPGRESYLKDFLSELPDAPKLNAESLQPMPIHFIGVWDTVRTLGVTVKGREITERFTRHHRPGLPAHVSHARHALALHELREDFEPTLWEDWNRKTQTLKQLWFPGNHSNVGGGYPDTVLSNVALCWMAKEAKGLNLVRNLPTVSGAASALVEREPWPRAESPRRALSHWNTLTKKTMQSLFMHETACQRLLHKGSRHYNFRNWITGQPLAISKKLSEVDDLTLRLHLELSFKYNKTPLR